MLLDIAAATGVVPTTARPIGCAKTRLVQDMIASMEREEAIFRRHERTGADSEPSQSAPRRQLTK